VIAVIAVVSDMPTVIMKDLCEVEGERTMVMTRTRTMIMIMTMTTIDCWGYLCV